MNKKLLSIVGCFVFSCVGFSDIKPLTNSKAKLATVLSSAATGIVAAGATYVAIDQVCGYIAADSDVKKLFVGGSGLVFFGLAYLMFDHIFSKYTPAKRIILAEALVRGAEQDSMLRSSFDNIDDLAVHINARFGTNWPLLCAREKLIDLLTKLAMVMSLTSNAAADAAGTDEYSDIAERAKVLLLKLPKITKVIENKIDLIIKYPDYTEQRKLFEKYQEAERQREFEAKQRQLDRIAKQAPKTSVVWVR